MDMHTNKELQIFLDILPFDGTVIHVNGIIDLPLKSGPVVMRAPGRFQDIAV